MTDGFNKKLPALRTAPATLDLPKALDILCQKFLVQVNNYKPLPSCTARWLSVFFIADKPQDFVQPIIPQTVHACGVNQALFRHSFLKNIFKSLMPLR